MATRKNQWFVPGDDIAREVITADIQRYLGPDALVRPGNGTGEHEGKQGYWITAYRTLTTAMIQDLKQDSERWRKESGRVTSYTDSVIHSSRQHYGPTMPSAPIEYPQTNPEPAPRPSSYAQAPPSHYATADQQHYTHVAPTQQYQSSPGYGAYQPPRTTQPTYGYSHEPPRENPYQQPPSNYYYQQSPVQEPPRAPTTYPPPPGSVRPGYYIASDGREYALPSQTQQPAPNSGRRRG